MQLDWIAIALYNGLHLLLSMVIGLVVVALVGYAERRPSRSGIVLIVIVVGFIATIIAVGSLTTAIRPLLPWWSIVLANALAVVLAGSYLLRKRPGTWGRLTPFGSGPPTFGKVN